MTKNRFKAFFVEYTGLCLKHKIYLSANDNFELEACDIDDSTQFSWITGDIRDLTSEDDTLTTNLTGSNEQCQYPQCLENEDERCPRWLTGECGGPNRGKTNDTP